MLALALPQTRDAFSGGGEELTSNRLSLARARRRRVPRAARCTGVGLGGFVAGSRLLEERTRRGHSPHNVVLTTAAELGVLGLAGPRRRSWRPRVHAAFRPRDPGWRRVLRLVVALELRR